MTNQIPPPLGTKLGNYRLDRVLGQGRMGIVYQALDEGLQRATALKVLFLASRHDFAEAAWEMVVAEARVVARLVHPNIVQVFSIGSQGGWPYLAMEYVDGTTAEATVADEGPLPVHQATDVLLQISMALQAAHASNVIHRDVKPANVLVGRDGTVKLGDFGLALERDARTSTLAAARVGTPYFTAPELWRYQRATPASDLYSLGATYYRLLTGRYPFPDRAEDALRTAHLEAEPPDPRDLYPAIPARAAEIVRTCLAKDPAARYPSARELGWAARGLLCATERSAHRARSGPLAMGTDRDEEARWPSFQPAMRTWAGLGFVHQPFSEVDPRRCPYQGEPFRGLTGVLSERLEEAGETTVLLGEPGSGRTVAVRQHEAVLRRSRFVLYLDLRGYRGLRSLSQRLIHAAGAPLEPGSAVSDSMDRLVETLTMRHRAHGQPPLLLLDGLTHEPQEERCLSSLVRSARVTGLFSVLLVDEPAAWQGGELAGAATIPQLLVPPLSGRQTIDYVRAWIDDALGPEAAPLIVPPDAALLLWHAAAGNLARINGIASNMLVLAAEQKRRVISSTTASAAAGQRRLLLGPEDVSRQLIRSIGVSPDAELLGVIARCRREAGMTERSSSELVALGEGACELALVTPAVS